MVVGAGFRRTSDDIDSRPDLDFTPASDTLERFSAYLQDDISLVPGKFNVVVGAKFEHHEYAGEEWQPSVRALYHIDHHQVLWAAASRAVRTPSRADLGVELDLSVMSPSSPGGLPVMTQATRGSGH